MITRVLRVLPCHLWVRITEAVLLTIVLLIALHFFYDWLGKVVLDQGGTVG